MKGRLIAAILVVACALAGLIFLAQPAEETMASIPEPVPFVPIETVPETTEKATEETTMPETTAPTLPPDPMQAILDGMTLEERVGQIFLARCPEENGAGDAARYHLGGFILFGRDFDGQTPDSVRARIASYQSAAKLPMLIAVDEEGGTVCRISDHPAFRLTRFASPRELYRQGGMDAVLKAESEKAWLLSSLGVNVNMAPVCDLSTQSGAFMYRRSLGQSAEITGEFVSGAVEAMAKFRVGAVMKHFPGYGNNADTHTGIAVDRRPLRELEEIDLQPFFAGIRAGGGAILVSHTIVEAIDAQMPGTLSEMMHRYLRLAMDFDGVIITDDLSMEAITLRYGAGESAVLAVLAGNDLLCSTEYAVQYDAVLSACQSGRIPESVLDSAVLHVLHWKETLGLMQFPV